MSDSRQRWALPVRNGIAKTPRDPHRIEHQRFCTMVSRYPSSIFCTLFPGLSSDVAESLRTLRIHCMATRTRSSGGESLEAVKTRLSPPPLYKVVILNDDFTPMDFVVEVLERFFGASDFLVYRP